MFCAQTPAFLINEYTAAAAAAAVDSAMFRHTPKAYGDWGSENTKTSPVNDYLSQVLYY